MLARHLRLLQKLMNPEEWLVDPATKKVHGGAHYPLAVFTHNSRGRSETSMKQRRETRPYHQQPWAQDAIAAAKAHNRSARDTATVAPFGTPAYISQTAPDGGPAAVWFPPDGGHAVGPQLRRGMAHASHMDRVLQRLENIEVRLEGAEGAAQWIQDSWSQWNGQQWGEDSRSQWEGQQEWSQSQWDQPRPPLRRKNEWGWNWNQRWSP